MEIVINGHSFKRFDKFWLSNVNFNGVAITFEIFQDEINEPLVKEILNELNGKLVDLKNNSQELLIALSKLFWGDDKNTEFSLSGLVIDEQINFHDSDFRMYVYCSGYNFQDYANWFIDVQYFRITGCWRQQL